MKRRTFLTAMVSTTMLPVSAEAQLPIVGIFRSSSRADSRRVVAALRQGLSAAGFAEGKTIALEERYADNVRHRLPELASDLIGKAASVIVANSIAAIAAKAATGSTPIVFITGSDPVRDGLVASLNRPGGNATGVVFITGALGAKRLALLRQVVPKATVISALIFPNTPETEAERKDLQTAAKAIGQELAIFDVTSDRDIEAAFASMVERKIGAALIGAGPFLFSKREMVAALASRDAIPAIHSNRESAEVGGLMSYGTSITEAYRQAGGYAARILKGEKPADLPVIQSSKFDFVINLTAAKVLGLEFHPQLLATADEVIE